VADVSTWHVEEPITPRHGGPDKERLAAAHELVAHAIQVVPEWAGTIENLTPETEVGTDRVGAAELEGLVSELKIRQQNSGPTVQPRRAFHGQPPQADPTRND